MFREVDILLVQVVSQTDYVLPEPFKCPRCFALIDEETLVEWE